MKPLPGARRGLDAGLAPHVAAHKSGGRDRWSAPLDVTPEDADAAALACLNEVLDPEIPIGLVDLGLVYAVTVEGRVARVTMTFTATACPCMDFITTDVRDRLLAEPWLDRVEIEEVWTPAWTVERISERGLERLKTLGVGV